METVEAGKLKVGDKFHSELFDLWFTVASIEFNEHDARITVKECNALLTIKLTKRVPCV